MVVKGACKKREQLAQKGLPAALTLRHALNPPNARGADASTAHYFTTNARTKENVP